MKPGCTSVDTAAACSPSGREGGDPVLVDVDLGAHAQQRRDGRDEAVLAAPDDPDRPPGDQAGYQVGEGFVAVALEAGLGTSQRRDALDDDAPVGGQLDPGPHALEEQGELEHLGFGGGVADDRLALRQGGRQQGRLRGADARVGELDDGAPEAAAPGADALVGHLDLGAEGLERLDVEVDRAPAYPVAADHGHKSFARQVQQRAEQQHGDPVEPAERKRHLGLGLFRRGDLELAVRPG